MKNIKKFIVCSVVPFFNNNGWPGILYQGQSIQGQGHKLKAKAKAGQSKAKKFGLKAKD